MLVAYESKSSSQFRKKTAEVANKCFFKLAFAVFFRQFKKVKAVMVFNRKRGLSLDRLRESLIKVRLIKQVFLVALVVDLVLQDGFRPPKASRRPQIELTLQGVFAARKNNEIFRPADFCNQWLQFWKIPITKV